MSKIISLLILLCISPILAIITLSIIIDDGFPVFFKQKRIGQNNRLFWIYKFRTMKKETPDIPTHMVKNPSLFFTKGGSFLRKTSLDELPQLINILKGEMIFVGPRPALYNQEDLKVLRTKYGVHTLIPGVTGWAQVNGRDELSIPEKVEMDTYYLENKSVWIDIKILLLTILKAFKLQGVSH